MPRSAAELPAPFPIGHGFANIAGMADRSDEPHRAHHVQFEPLRWIGTYKIAKGMLALIAGLMLLRLMHKDLPQIAIHLMVRLRIEPHSEFGKTILHRMLMVKKGNMGWIAAALFAYVPLTCAEGIGLMMRKLWAEWVTVFTTFALIPVEIREIVVRVTWLRVLLLVLNIAVLIYLTARIKRDRRHHSTSGSDVHTEIPTPAAHFERSTDPSQPSHR
jgi:uncharacterized membrane protein (DUF2068 family)